jgi:hypothetical protein
MESVYTCWVRDERGSVALYLFAASPAADKSLIVSGSVSPSVTAFRAASFVASSGCLDMMETCWVRDTSIDMGVNGMCGQAQANRTDERRSSGSVAGSTIRRARKRHFFWPTVLSCWLPSQRCSRDYLPYWRTLD